MLDNRVHHVFEVGKSDGTAVEPVVRDEPLR